MNWYDRNCFETGYFDDIIAALKSHSFLQTDSAQSPTDQIGTGIIDRVDQVMKVVHLEGGAKVLGDKAAEAFEVCTELFPSEVTEYLRNSSSQRSFPGLFNTANLDLYAMWYRIAKRTISNWHMESSWLHRLANALIRDPEFGEKIGEAAACNRQGMNRGDALLQIEDHYRMLGSSNASAKSLLLLDLL